MKNKLPNINSNTGRFIDGNPATGTLGTIVTAEWLNGVQERVQDVFEELRNVLLLGNLQPDGQRQNQVAEAIKAYCNNINLKVQSNTRNFDNYIPNSKKSNAVDSNSADMVATSFAAKTAYDKGVEARTAVDNLDSVAYKVNKSVGYAGNTTALMRENTVFSTTDGSLLDLPSTAYKWGAGVSMSTNGGKALLYIAHSNSQVWAKGGYSEDYSQPWKRLDGADWVDVRDRPSSVNHYGFLDFDVADVLDADLNHITKPGLYGQRASAGATLGRNYPIQEAGTLLVTPSAYGVQQEYTTYHANQKYVRGKLDTVWQSWKRIDGLDKASRAGDTFTGTVAVREGDWSGIELYNIAGKYLRFETNPDHASYFGSFIYRNATGANEAVIYVPKKVGTMALIEDIAHTVRASVSRSTKSRTINGDSADDNGTAKQMEMVGEVVVYPDGKIEQFFHLKQFRDIWFAKEEAAVGVGNNDSWGRLIPIPLWTAMPNKVLYVDAQPARSSSTSLSAMYKAEAVEHQVSWAIRKQGTNKGQIWIDIGRIVGGYSEHIDLIIKVEGY